MIKKLHFHYKNTKLFRYFLNLGIPFLFGMLSVELTGYFLNSWQWWAMAIPFWIIWGSAIIYISKDRK